mgnify:CR=1 FL=1
MTQDIKESRYLVTINDNPPAIMCEKHAQMFEKVMTIAEIPHTIIEMEDEDSGKKCHACNLTSDIKIGRAHV